MLFGHYYGLFSKMTLQPNTYYTTTTTATVNFSAMILSFHFKGANISILSSLIVFVLQCV